MSRRVHISKEIVPINSVLYRIKYLRSFDSSTGTLAYSMVPDNPMQWGVKHPLQQFCEDIMAGVVFPDTLALDSISTYDAAIAAFLFLYPESVHSPQVRGFVEAAALYDVWGSNALADVEKSYLFMLQSLDAILPREDQAKNLRDSDYEDILSEAVKFIEESIHYRVVDLNEVKGVDRIHWKNDRCVMFSSANGSHLPNLWDSIFSSGKFIGVVFHASSEISEGHTHVSIVRKTLLVPDLNFDTLVDQIGTIESRWRLVSPLAVVSPPNGTTITPEQLAKCLFSR